MTRFSSREDILRYEASKFFVLRHKVPPSLPSKRRFFLSDLSAYVRTYTNLNEESSVSLLSLIILYLLTYSLTQLPDRARLFRKRNHLQNTVVEVLPSGIKTQLEGKVL